MPWRDRSRNLRVPTHFDGRRRTSSKRTREDDDGSLTLVRERRFRAPVQALAPGVGVFADVVAFIDGWCPGGANVVRDAIASLGGVTALYYDKRVVTHYVCESYDGMDADARRRAERMTCVRSAWVIDSALRRAKLSEDDYAPSGNAPKRNGRNATTDLVDFVVDGVWNGTGGVATQREMNHTWCVRVVFERVERAMSDGKTKDVDARRASHKAYDALKKIVDMKFVIPIGAGEALVDVAGLRNFQKRNRFESSQTSPANAAEMLEWVMVDKTGVNVRASMHDVREDGWSPDWLASESRGSIESNGVVTRRASRQAAVPRVAAAGDRPPLDTQTLSQVSNIDDETLDALDPATRYEWQKAREHAAKKKVNHERAKQSAVFQLLSATGNFDDAKGKSKARVGASAKRLSPMKAVALQPVAKTRTPPQPKRVNRGGAQLSIKSFASPVKKAPLAPARSFVGESVMASASVHTPTLIHAFTQLLERDALDPVPDRVGAACAVMRAHIEQLERDGRRAAARQVRAAVSDVRCQHPEFTPEMRNRALCRDSGGVSLGMNSQ